MIRFLFGAPGTGKTHMVYERILSDIPAASASGGHVYLVVPEQTMYASEAAFLSALPPDAGQVFSVLSFSRLCDVLADRFGGRTFTTLTRASKALLMWRNLRELRGLMESYVTPDGDDTSLCRLMLDISTELSVNAISPAQLETAVERLPSDSPLRRKVRDIALVTAAYEGLVRDLTGGAPSDRMLRAVNQVRTHDFFAGANVYIDSFTSFTPEEYLLIREIFAGADNVTVTIPAEGRQANDSDFISVYETIKRLRSLCEEVGEGYEDIVLTGNRRTASPVLRVLGRELWDFPLTADARYMPSDADLDGDPLRLVTAPNVYEEARAAALHIGELHTSGIPYESIAVVVRDTAEWRGVLDACFDTYGIPYFLSDRTGLSEKPAARLLLLALRCIRRGYLSGDVISLAKTGLCGVSLHDLDAFEEYVEAWHICGRRMKEAPWSMNPDGYRVERSERGDAILAAANRARDVLIPPLASLERELKASETPEEQCRALFSYLSRLSVRVQMTDEAKAQLAAGHVKDAGETVRLWSFIVHALADLSSLLDPAGGALSPDDLSAALSILFEETDIGSVPARHDCVTIGSASTVRLENVRAVLLLGLVEGEFPRAVTDTGLLTEQEKSALNGLGIELQSRADRQTSEELLYIARAVTKASDRVLLFTHEGTPDNTVKSPSIAWTRVRWLFPAIQPIRFCERSLMPPGDAPARYATPVADNVSRAVVRTALPDPFWLSHSALRNYARCPYSYFGGHILKIRQRVEAKIDYMNAGVFLHDIFEHFLLEAVKDGPAIRHLDEAEITSIADRIMDDYIRKLGADTEDDGRILHLFARLRDMALVLLRSIQAELEQGLFYVAALEWDSHGRTPGDPQPMELSVEVEMPDAEDGLFGLPVRGGIPQNDTDLFSLPSLKKQTVRVLMGGRIDRVDVYRDGRTVYIRVIDYKSSVHQFSEAAVQRDMDIQMLLYLFTLCAPRNRRLFADDDGILPDNVLPAEVMYLSPQTDPKTGVITPYRSGLILDVPQVLGAASPSGDLSYLPGVSRTKSGELAGSSLCSPAHMQELETQLRELIGEASRAILEGRAARTPSGNACRFCTMRDSCAVAERGGTY